MALHKCGGSLSAVFGTAVPVREGGSCWFAAPAWGRAGCPALCRVRLPLDVGEEVEQRSPEGSDSAFSLLLLIIVTLLIFLFGESSL